MIVGGRYNSISTRRTSAARAKPCHPPIRAQSCRKNSSRRWKLSECTKIEGPTARTFSSLKRRMRNLRTSWEKRRFSMSPLQSRHLLRCCVPNAARGHGPAYSPEITRSNDRHYRKGRTEGTSQSSLDISAECEGASLLLHLCSTSNTTSRHQATEVFDGNTRRMSTLSCPRRRFSEHLHLVSVII